MSKRTDLLIAAAVDHIEAADEAAGVEDFNVAMSRLNAATAVSQVAAASALRDLNRTVTATLHTLNQLTAILKNRGDHAETQDPHTPTN